MCVFISAHIFFSSHIFGVLRFVIFFHSLTGGLANEDDPYSSGEEYEEVINTPARKSRRQTRSAKKKGSKYDKSPAPPPTLAQAAAFLSVADADINPTTGPVEGIILSMPYKRQQLRGNSLNEHTYWNITVLVYSKDDRALVKSQVIKEDGEMKKVRITKPKVPSYFKGGKLATVGDLIISNDPSAGKGFAQGVNQHIHENEVVVDVHLPRAIHQNVRLLQSTHCSLTRGGVPCSLCKQKLVADTANAVVFEVEEVSFIATADATVRGLDKTADLSE